MKRALLFSVLLAIVAEQAGAGVLVDRLKARQARVDAILKTSPDELPPAEKKKLEEALTGAIDFHEMAKQALGAEWDKRSAAEQKTFGEAFEALLRASLLRRVNIYRIDGITYDDEKMEAAAGAVRTTVRVKEATTEVAYTFQKTGTEWRIVDYALDGVSTVRNYRAQFAKILAKSSFAGLVDRVHQRAVEIQSEK